MNANLQKAKEMLFGEQGMKVSNFKMFPGFSREASAEKVSAELVSALELLKEGKFRVVANVGE
ncbi:hypothetical protein [Stenotrophomonas maltophilia]|uniref:hypothetical protein n=1 Tax=Stenotrophomonas maltophilia TaxID=40324 RepID=UPI001FA6C720|nr:hypothetical protein [Stenotrophomonas maltophilia]